MNKVELIFNMYKDKSIISKKFKNKIKEKFDLPERVISDLFVKIQNYQIDTYGNRLTLGRDIYSKEQLDRMSQYARTRKHYKKNRGI